MTDRKKTDNENKTNQFIDYLLRQNEEIAKQYIENAFVENRLEEQFAELNKKITELYCNNLIFDYFKNHKLEKCNEEIKEYFISGYCITKKKK